jgi:hypothetical protein
LRRGRQKREQNGGDEPNQVHCMYAYMEMSQQKPPKQLLYTNKNIKKMKKEIIGK